jgi:hypothetical protein
MNPNHDSMDDTGEFGAKMNTREGYHRVPKGLDYQGRWPQAAESCTELGADDDEPHVSGALVWPVRIVLAVILVMACWHLAALLVKVTA